LLLLLLLLIVQVIEFHSLPWHKSFRFKSIMELFIQFFFVESFLPFAGTAALIALELASNCPSSKACTKWFR